MCSLSNWTTQFIVIKLVSDIKKNLSMSEHAFFFLVPTNRQIVEMFKSTNMCQPKPSTVSKFMKYIIQFGKAGQAIVWKH